MKDRQLSSTSYPMTFLLVSSADHVSAVTGASPTVTLSKNGAAFASPAGAVTEIGSGKYALAGNATDRGSLGELAIHATATGADPADKEYTIVAWDPFDAVRGGFTALPNAAASAIGGLPVAVDTSGRVDVLKVNGTSQTARDLGASVLLSTGTGTGQLDFTSGVVKANATQLLGTAWLTPGVAGTPDVNAKLIAAVVPGSATIGTVTTATTATNLTTNNDKTGYGLSTTAVQAIWDALTSALTTVGSIGKKLADWSIGTAQTGDSYARIGAAGAGLTALGDTRIANLDATITSRTKPADTQAAVTLVTTTTNLTTNNDKTGYSLTVTPPTAAAISTAVWAETSRTLSSFGTLVADAATAVWAAATRTLSAFGFSISVDPDPDVADIKAKTDLIPPSPAAVGDIPTAAETADQILGRNLAGGSDGGRMVKDALRFSRNKVVIDTIAKTITVYAENDTDVAWTGVLTTSASAELITSMDPA